MLAGIEAQAYVDIDSLLQPVYGKTKQGASFGHTKIAGKQVLRKGLSPLATTISTDTGAPVIAGIRLRAGKAGSGRAAGPMVKEAVRTAPAAGATGTILVRGESLGRPAAQPCPRPPQPSRHNPGEEPHEDPRIEAKASSPASMASLTLVGTRR